jgi:hypothetical protein
MEPEVPLGPPDGGDRGKTINPGKERSLLDKLLFKDIQGNLVIL